MLTFLERLKIPVPISIDTTSSTNAYLDATMEEYISCYEYDLEPWCG